MPSKVSRFRSGGGLLTPAGSTGRPGRTAVGGGPAGPSAGVAPERSAHEALSQVEIASFDGWMKSSGGREAADGVCARIRGERQFDDWAFTAWWSKSRNDAVALEQETCARFFRKPFRGVLVERTARREIVAGLERGPWREDPLLVRAFADAGELTGFERSGDGLAGDFPVTSATPRLAQRVEQLLREGTLLALADERLVQVWYVLTMRDVVLHRGDSSAWQTVARREVDRRSPALFHKVTWLTAGRWSPF
jgi:hypothetical protein